MLRRAYHHGALKKGVWTQSTTSASKTAVFNAGTAVPFRAAAAAAAVSKSTTVKAPMYRTVTTSASRTGHSQLFSKKQIRRSSTSSTQPQLYDFEQIQQFSSSPSAERVLIDVREPYEFEAGNIPGSINVPIQSSPEALILPADEFEDRFGMPKPTVDQEVIFYCKAGVRSKAAANIAQQAGYPKIGNYLGSWLDWEAKGGQRHK